MHRGPAYRFAAGTLRPLVRILTRRTWHHADRLPVAGGVVLAVNHQCFLDPLVVGYFVDEAGREPRFLAKAELFRVPVLGRLLRSAGQIPVHRRTKAAARAYADAVAAVERGECVVIYPEGTLTYDPELWPMRGRHGAARVALATRAPLVPAAQWGIQELLPPRTGRLRPRLRTPVSLAVGDPVDLEDLYARAAEPGVAELATERLMADVTRLLEGLRGASAPPVRFDPATMSHPAPPVRADRRPVPEEESTRMSDRTDVPDRSGGLA